MSVYTDHINSLPDSVRKQTIYFFENGPLAIHYNRFFDFCLTNVSTQWHQFNIAGCGFFFRDSLVNNACADFDVDGNQWIEINGGLFQNLFYKFYSEREYFRALPEGPLIRNLHRDDEAAYLMFQGAVMFLYYHELAHIIQFSDQNLALSGHALSENNSNSVSQQPYDIVRHALEMDADEFAANMLYEQIAFYFSELADEQKTREILSALMTTGLASVFLLFEMLQGGIRLPIYFDSESHPNSVIRIVSITNLILDKLEAQFGNEYVLSMNEVIRRAFEIIQPVTDAPNSLENFFTALRNNAPRIVQYSQEIMRVRNRYPQMAGVRMRV